MANNLRVFNTNSEYQSANLVYPAVSYVVDIDKVVYDMTAPPFQGKWKATYSDGSVVTAQCDATSAITSGEINKTSLESVEIGDCVTTIGGGVFFICSSLTSIDIPNSVTSIGSQAFYRCTSLTSVTIGSGVTSIGNQVFYECSGLTSINIPSGVTSIGRAAFETCSSLTSINIPSGVTSIDDRAFGWCASLESITINAETPPTLGYYGYSMSYAFYGSTCPIYVPSGSVETYKTANKWTDYASRIQAIP